MRHVFLFAVSLTIACAGFAASDDAASDYRTLSVGGVEREWSLFLPDSYDGATVLPLLIEFHGTGSTPEAQQRLSAFPALAQEQGFIIVAPKAAYPRSVDQRLTWNVDLHEDAVDDVAFIEALLDHVVANYSVDEERIFASGFSGGARMSSRVACDLSHRVAAIAPVGGIRFPEVCEPRRPVPVISFHGRKDNVNHYDHQPDSPDYWRMGVEEAMGGWVSNNRCNESPVVEEISPTDRRRTYPDCAGEGDVVFYVSDVASHTWPGSPLAERMRERWGAVTSAVPATALIWSFFQSHPLPPHAGAE